MQVEWDKRWKAFPKKLFVALAKYHSVTLTMRLFESICSLFCNVSTMDKLTMDFFAASRTLATNMMSSQGVGSKNQTMTSAVRTKPISVMTEMTATTFWANLLITLADYSVHQVLLCYGYYMYYERQRKKTKQQQSAESNVDEEKDYKQLKRTLTDHLLQHSIQLFCARSCGLVCGSIGAGIGTIIKPGWGTLMISSMAEGAAPSLVDDGSAAATAELTSDKPKPKPKLA
jgi:hypothetical protein